MDDDKWRPGVAQRPESVVAARPRLLPSVLLSLARLDAARNHKALQGIACREFIATRPLTRLDNCSAENGLTAATKTN